MRAILRSLIFVLVVFSASLYAVGQAALPTLLLAPGARATGTGEAFVAVADDVDATFYNPGAMGLAPLSSTWRTYTLPNHETFIALAGKEKLFFAERPTLWAATRQGLYKFDGNNWLDYEVYYLEQNDNIEKVVRKYLGLGDAASDDSILKIAVAEVRQFNHLLPSDDEEGLPDFKLPFSVALKGESMLCLEADDANKLWVGTLSGLFFYNGSKWKKYTVADDLPDNKIRCINSDEEVWVGTDKGAARFSGGKWRAFPTAEFVKSDTITALQPDDGGALWIGTTNGLIRKKGKSVTLYDSTNGLVDNRVSGLSIDKDRNVWAATQNGVARYRLKNWKQSRMDDNEVYTVRADSRDYIWVGTRKGALRYFKGTSKLEEGSRVVEGAFWKHFHSKNGLPSDKVLKVISQSKDVWFLTDRGVCRYDKAERQIGAFWENLLPEFGLKDLYHLYFSTTWPTEDWGTVGAFVKYISFGQNEWTDEVGRTLGTFRSFDLFAGVSYGTNFGDNIGIGVTPKFIYSKLADVPVGNENRRGIANSFAVDMGYKQKNVVEGLDFGLCFQNMGPDIVYIDQNQADPIPFNMRAGLAYRAIDNPIHNLKVLFDINRELVKRNDPNPPDPFWKALFTSLNDQPWREELKENIYSLGIEYWYSHFLAFRLGEMYDKAGSRGEHTFGLGINYGNIHFNGSYIVGSNFLDNLIGKGSSPEFDSEGSARNKQLRLSLIFMY